MVNRLLAVTSAALLVTGSALAQNAGQPAAGDQVDRPSVELPAPDAQQASPAPSAQPMQDAAQDPQTAAKPDGTIMPAEEPSQVRAEKLIGMDVVNATGEEIGSVDDLVLDESGKITGLVVKTGGFLGLGGKSVAIAWQDIQSAISAENVTISLTKEELDQAPAFKTKERQEAEAAASRPAPVGGAPASPSR